MDGGREGLDGRGLRQARNPFEQNVASRQQCDQEPLKHLILPDQDLAYLGLDPFKLVRVLENLVLDPLNVNAHGLRSTLRISLYQCPVSPPTIPGLVAGQAQPARPTSEVSPRTL